MIQESQAVLTMLLCFLAAAAYYDYKTQTVHLFLIISGMTAAVACRVAEGTFHSTQLISGSLGGIFLLMLSLATHQAIGGGDGMILIITGVFLGWRSNYRLLLIALLLSAVYAVLCLAAGIKHKNENIPFVPFLFGGYILLIGI